jgi:hypothetical protein
MCAARHTSIFSAFMRHGCFGEIFPMEDFTFILNRLKLTHEPLAT